MYDPIIEARAESVQEIAGLMLKAAAEGTLRHGSDPDSEIIMVAAIAYFIHKASTVYSPTFRRAICAMIKVDQ